MVLGKRLKGAFKAVTASIKELTNEHLETFQKTGEFLGWEESKKKKKKNQDGETIVCSNFFLWIMSNLHCFAFHALVVICLNRIFAGPIPTSSTIDQSSKRYPFSNYRLTWRSPKVSGEESEGQQGLENFTSHTTLRFQAKFIGNN